MMTTRTANQTLMRSLFTLLSFALTSLCFAQGYSLSVEEYYVHPANSGELAGFTTYRVYLDCVNPTDFLSSCSGDVDNPLIISSTSGTWYNSSFVTTWNAGGINSLLFSFFPDVAYDSFLTIGSEESAQSPHPWGFNGDSSLFDEFNATTNEDGSIFGSNVIVNQVSGTAWYTNFPGLEETEVHPGFAGEDLKVLIMQITTTGSLSGQAYLQVFPQGDFAQEFRDVLSFDSNPGGGCTDATACNFDPEATVDDGTCLQLDACGECGGPGIPEGDCDCEGNQLDAIGVCGGVCLCDGNANGICDVDEIVGCTYSFAENFNPLASFDDGSCTLPNSEEPGCGLIYDGNNDGAVGSADLLGLLTEFGAECTPASAFTCGDPVSYQGYDYATVLIGDQCWFAENLRSENYENGDAIPAGLSGSDWGSTSTGASAVYGEGDSTCTSLSPDGDACEELWSLNEYGRLYNWFAVDDSRGLCPSGWHVPTDEEWTAMTENLGGDSIAGGLMKAGNGWFDEGNGTNASGFSGLPGGFRDFNGNFFSSAGTDGVWWSSSPNESDAWFRYMEANHVHVNRSWFSPLSGYSIRCIQDAPQ